MDLAAFRQTCVCRPQPRSATVLLWKLNNSWLCLIPSPTQPPTHTHRHTPICCSLWMLLSGCQSHAETTINISLSPELKRKFAKAPAASLKLETGCKYLNNLPTKDNERGRVDKPMTCQDIWFVVYLSKWMHKRRNLRTQPSPDSGSMTLLLGVLARNSFFSWTRYRKRSTTKKLLAKVSKWSFDKTIQSCPLGDGHKCSRQH